MDYVEKIKACLALAESPNEHEARSALLKARQLMAKYKVSEGSVKDKEKEDVIRKNTGIDYSVRRDPWMSALASVIAKNHCCRNFQLRAKGKQVAEIGFVGLSGDIPVCLEVFRYAVDCIRSVTRTLKKTKGVRAANGYGYGFVVGLDEAYSKQQEEEGWGLVLVVPEAVDRTMANTPKISNKAHMNKLKDADARAFCKGIKDGHRFKEQKRIGGNDEEKS